MNDSTEIKSKGDEGKVASCLAWIETNQLQLLQVTGLLRRDKIQVLGEDDLRILFNDFLGIGLHFFQHAT